jgi:spore coat protein CotH
MIMRARPAVLAAILVVLGALPALGQSADELFDVKTLQEIRLSVNTRDLATLRQTYQANTYYPADLAWKTVKVRNVGIRSRGQGSRNPTKLGLRVDMAHYTTNQTFVGLSTIILDNIWQDDSMLRERLTFTMFELMGVAVPRESFCRLYINNQYQGLYAITEEIDADFARRVTGQTDGTVFEFHWGADRQFRAEDLGSIAAYKLLFEPRTHVLDADSTLYNPIVNLFKEANGPDDAVWRSRVEEYLDLEAFVKQAAIEMFMIENDGVLGFAGMNNFYLYRNQGTTRHRLFAWDKDQAFIAPPRDAPIRVTSDNVLFNRAMSYPDLRAIFLTALEDCARIAATDNFLALEIDRVVAVIFDAVRSDPRKQWPEPEVWDQAVERLRLFAAERPAFVLEEVGKIRRGQ